MTQILIRTDIGGIYGMGHALRCKALAQVLVARSATVEFLTTTPALRAFVAPLQCWCVTDTSQESVFSSVLGHEPDVAVFDTTTPFDEALYPLIRQGCGCAEPVDHTTTISIVRIDQHATIETAELVIFPNAHQSPGTLASLEHDFPGRVLHGWDYVMLHPDVAALLSVPYAKRTNGPVVCCAGGSDSDGALGQMYDWAETLLPDQEKIFLVGSHHHGRLRDALSSDATCWNEEMTTRRVFEPFDRRHLRDAALVVTLFGQTVYECIALGTPVLTFARTASDADALARLKNAGINPVQSGYPPLWSAMTQARFCATVEAYMDEDVRRGMHAASVGLIDGHGVERVAEAILALT